MSDDVVRNAGVPGGASAERDGVSRRPAFTPDGGVPGGLESVESRLDAHLAHCRETIAAAARARPVTWASLMRPQAEAHNALSLFWSPVSHLNAVMNTEALREVYKRCLPKLSAYWTELGQNVELHAATLALRESDAFEALSEAERREIDNDLRDFELGGVALDAAGKSRFGEIAQELSRLSTEFSDAVLDATNAWETLVDDVARLDGLPDSAVAAARSRAADKGLDGWLLNLEFPVYHAVMTFANDRALREELYTAFVTRASERGPHAGRWDNAERMREILRLRAAKATLLGRASYAELSMARKMVESPEQVIAFLDDLAERAVPKAREEFDALGAFARTLAGGAGAAGADPAGVGRTAPAADVDSVAERVAAWDVLWLSDRLKRRDHDLSDEDLKPYFPATRAIPGLFAVCGRLFGLEITRDESAEVYHRDVAYYTVRDAAGALRGGFYLDPYAREHKRGGAWMDVCATRQRTGEVVQLPIAYLVCNLTPPLDGPDGERQPALLTHQEVTTLFHEFGHGLHHLLTRVETAGVSGIAGVEWDAVELPSQFLENWCWERESLDLIAGHVDTGEPLPDDLLERLRGARHFQSAMQLVRQLELALFDMRLHLDSSPEAAADPQATIDAVRARVAVVPAPAFNRFQNGFSHIFAGGYAAGYFSYKWAEVLSADAFARFEEEGVMNPDTGRDFMESVLEVGGSRDAMRSFVAFRGREPSIEPLLRQSGLLDGAAETTSA